MEHSTDKKNKIGIVIPVYNAAKYITKCIKSILLQSFKEWELVLVDDGSTDGSSKILDQYAQKDLRIYVIHQENAGSIVARKAGVFCERIQSCKYCTFCDADDYLPDNCLELLLRNAIDLSVDLVVGRVEKVYKKIVLHSKFIPKCFKITAPEIYDHESFIRDLYISFFGVSNFPVCIYAKLYKTEDVTKAFQEESPVRFFGDDQYITLQVAPTVKKMAIIPDIVYYYRIGGGTSTVKDYMLDDFIALYNYKLLFIEKYPMPQNAHLYLDIEMVNVVRDYLTRFVTLGKYSGKRLEDKVVYSCNKQTVEEAAKRVAEADVYNSSFAYLVANKAIEEIVVEVNTIPRKNRIKQALKNVLMKI